ncbi:MAG TPA: hypothetical protein VHK69_20240 [Chitinophagaceae bacterium]|jgi:hypothetical protein|nr:hypothetical protein [Chitinophagaceae bacterium]
MNPQKKQQRARRIRRSAFLQWSGLLLFLGAYAAVHVATKKCDEECIRREELMDAIRKDRPYVMYASVYNDSTLSVFVKEVPGIDWDRLADTACMFAHSKGLSRKFVAVIRYDPPADTLARQPCH